MIATAMRHTPNANGRCTHPLGIAMTKANTTQSAIHTAAPASANAGLMRRF